LDNQVQFQGQSFRPLNLRRLHLCWTIIQHQ